VAKQRNALRAGIFMIVSVALIFFVVVAISGAGRFTQSFTTYSVAFNLQDDIGGLRPSDDVRIGGLKVGSVRDIHIDQDHDAVIVVIEIPTKFSLASDAHVSVQHGLTGAASINIDDLGKGPRVGADEFLAGQPDQLVGLMHMLAAMKPDIRDVLTNVKTASVKLNTDLDKLADTADSFHATGEAATDTVQNLRVRLPEVIDHYDELIATADHMLDVVRDFFGASHGDFHQTLVNLNHITGNLSDRIPQILDQIHGLLAKADGAVDHASSALIDVQTTAKNLRSASQTLRSVLTDNQSKLNGIIGSLKDTADNLKDASLEIRHAPWRLLYQPKPGEVANLNIYDSVRQFAEGANSLDDAASALRDALNNPNADPEQVKRLMTNLDNSFSKFQDVQAKLWKDIKN
jgi:ABC-type transporter Mla subunit MlaD